MSILLYNYYHRYKEHRKQIKILVDTEDYTNAKLKLDSVIEEHETMYTNIEERKDFNFGEKMNLNHIRAHLNGVINFNDPSFIDDGITKHHSDIVKNALDYQTKQDYSSD